MNESTQNLGVGIALLDRLTNYTLPRLQDLKQRVDAGERLGEEDLDFLREAMERTGVAHQLVSDDPVSQALYAKVVQFYHEITAQGLKNEQGSR